jgi:alpha-L-fucosidase 2
VTPIGSRAQEDWRTSRLTYPAPAQRWTEALPLGNGWLGAMVHGGVHDELVHLNADTFWSGAPRDWDVPGAAEAVRNARALTLADDPEGAERELRAAQGPFAESYLPLGDVVLRYQHDADDITDYQRGLDLDTAGAWTTYRTSQARYRRTAWVDADLGVVAIDHEVDGATLEVLLGLRGPFAVATTAVAADGLQLTCKAPAHVVPPYLASEHPFVHDERPGRGMYAVAALRILTDGLIEVRDTELVVSGARRMTLLVTAATGYRGHGSAPDRTAGECRREAADRLASAVERFEGEGVRRILASHVERHRQLFRSVHLDLGTASRPTSDTSELIRASSADEDRAHELTTLLFHYGRYLLIASSQPGTQAANLQGIWNRDPRPAWSSNYTLNINTQMNYWLAGPAGLIDLQLPLLQLVRELAATGARTASTSYGLPGWVAHHNTDLWRQSMAVGEGSFPAVWSSWWMGGAWLAHHIWDHYTFTLDVDRLRSLFPVLRSAAEFLLAWLVEAPDGTLITAPSTSPENTYLTPDGRVVSVTTAATMDLALIAQVFDDVANSCLVLDTDHDFAHRCRDARARLRTPRVGSRGQLLEWPHEPPELDQHHRHVSHLVGLFPGDVHASDDVLAAAARVTLDERGDASTGWSRAWKANLWARLGDGDRANRLLRGFCTEVTTEDVTEQGGVYANLLCAHPPFQIDGNFGFTSAICQMLLDSRLGRLVLLPALPRTWPDGAVRGLVARGGIVADLRWREGRLMEAVLHSTQDQTVSVAYRGETRTVHLAAGESFSVPLGAGRGRVPGA